MSKSLYFSSVFNFYRFVVWPNHRVCMKEEEMLPASGSGDQATMHQVRCKRNKGSLSATTINEVLMRSYLPPTKLVSLLEKKN